MSGTIVDSTAAQDAAEAARSRPEVVRWMRRLQRLMADMPDGLEMFVGETVAVCATGPNGESFHTSTGCHDASSVVDSYNDRRWDGGAW